MTNNTSPPDFSDKSQWEMLFTCPLCGHDSISAVMQMRDWHYGNVGVFTIVECENCSLQFVNPMPTADYLSRAYPADYYAYFITHPDTTKERIVDAIKRLIRFGLFYHPTTTRDPTFEKPGTMLDFGCGAGTFIATMREKGWEVHGVDFDARAAERGRKAGLDIFGGTINDAGFPSATFDYVRSNHSFEHLERPREVLRELRRIIKPSGTLFIGVPNVAGFMALRFGRYWWYRGAPTHTFGYSPKSIKLLVEQEGFEVVRVNYNSNFAGIFGSMQIYLNRDNGKSSEDGWLLSNPFLKLPGQWIARIADFFRAGDCIEVIAKPK